MDTAKNFGERLAHHRKNLNLSQSVFAEKCGIKQTTYSAYELNKADPSLETLNKIAGLGADIHYLVTGKKFESCMEMDHSAVLKSTVVGLKRQLDMLARQVKTNTEQTLAVARKLHDHERVKP